MLNRIDLQGRLVNDLELKTTGTGTAVLTFALAVERDFKDSDGKRATDFFDCVAWRNTAEFISKYFAKGDMMICSGRLQNRSYETQDGQKRKVTEIVIDNVYFGAKNNSANTAAASEQKKSGDDGFMSVPDGVEDEGLPFN